jgi:hypothetical protein
MVSDEAPFQKQDTRSSPTTTKSPNSMPNDTKPAFPEEEFNKTQESLGQLIIKQQTLTTMHQFCSYSPPPSPPKTKKHIESNNLCRNEILRQVSQEESKKDRTQKIHPSIIKMICRAAALCSTDETEALPATCSLFIDQENGRMAQYNLVHQFKEQGFHNVTFALGTTNALYVGGFLYADSSTPSNITIFAFHEQEPNSDNHQHDYLICHLIQVEGQKKSLEEIKALLKQSVQVPSDFNGFGTQIQLFGAALTIFFCKDSVCTLSLNQLLTMIGRNKKSFQDQIAFDDFFATKFLFAIDG